MALPIPPPNLTLFIAYLITIMLHQLFQLMYLHWAIPISCLDFQTLLKHFLLSKCLKVTVNLEPAWTVGCQLHCQFCIKSLQLLPDFSCSKYQICQFQAMCSIAFYAFLKVGEMTSTNRHGPLDLYKFIK